MKIYKAFTDPDTLNMCTTLEAPLMKEWLESQGCKIDERFPDLLEGTYMSDMSDYIEVHFYDEF